MATITIKDLRKDCTLDRKAMSSIKGAGGAPWVYGWIKPFVERSSSFGAAVVNFYQTNHIYVADQMNNQIQMIDINNSASDANITMHAKQSASNAEFA